MTIKMLPVKSSQVESIGYDPMTRTLAINYKSGSLYHYHEVPTVVFTDMQKAESVGKFIHANIKLKYKFTNTTEKKREPTAS